MSWPWVDSILPGKAGGSYTKLNTNYPWSAGVALARTRANFDAGSTWQDDAAVLAAVKAAAAATMAAFSCPAIDPTTGDVVFRGGGHGDSGDGSFFRLPLSLSTFAWALEKKSARINTTQHQISCGIVSIANTNPARIQVDADIAIDGDQGAIAGTGTALDGNTYQLVRVDSTHVDLYNTDGSIDTKYTPFDGSALADSTGTLTITVGANSVDGSNYYAHPNADGEQMPPAAHSYHWKNTSVTSSDDAWLLSGKYVFDGGTGGQLQNRFWHYKAGVVYRGYHDPLTDKNSSDAETDCGGPWLNGPYAFDPVLKRVVGFTPDVRAWNYRTFAWESGYDTDSDYQVVHSLATHATAVAVEGADACVLPQPGTPAQRALFSLQSVNTFVFCIDTGGSAVMSENTFSDGNYFSADMAGLASIGEWWDDLNGQIVYWGGGSTVGAINPSATLSSWTTEEITPATPTGDVPVLTDYADNAGCAICKVPGYDAYLLARGGDVYLYARSDISANGLSGDSYADANAVGALTHSIPLVAATVSLSTSSGTITSTIPLAGDSAAVSDSDGALTSQISLSGDAVAQAVALATWGHGMPLSGDAMAEAVASGSLSISFSLNGNAIAKAIASGSLQADGIALAGNAAASASSGGAVVHDIPLAGSAMIASNADGSLASIIPLAASTASVTSVVGSLDVRMNIAGNADADAIATGALTFKVNLDSAAVSRAAASGALSSSGGHSLAPIERIINTAFENRVMPA